MAEMTVADIIDNADSFAYCPNCQVKVAPCRITFEELHDSCGHTILWVDDATPIIAMQNLIEQQAAEIAKKDRMIADLTNIRDIQGEKGNYDQDEYMRGLFNGLEMALSIFTQQEPQFKDFEKEAQGVE